MFSFNPSAYRVKRLLFAALVLATCTLFWYQFDIIREHAGLSGETTWVPKLSGHKSGAPAASNSHAQSVLGPTTTHVPVFLGATSAVVTPASAESSTLSTETTVSVKGAVSSTETPTSIVTVMESAQFTSTATKEGKPTGTPSDPLQRTNKEPNATFLELAPKYHQAFLTPEDESFKRLQCPAPTHGRYNYFRGGKSTNMTATRRKYFFALNLHQNTPVLPRLIGSVVEAMRFLGTEHCALSIVEGRSNDGTYEILSSWKTEMKKLGVPYYFTSSDVDPMAGDRIGSLATLRNGALQHLMDHPKAYSADASVIFLNDIAICMEDILELVHQRLNLGADMVCGMDWADQLGTFYDVWVSRTLTGDLFFPIPDDGSWDQSSKLFASDKNAKARFDRKMPFQVFACWNGGAVFTAKPLQEAKLKFRTSRPGECFAGEPTVFCKDMWWHGYGKIAVIPTVNVDYTDAGASHVKEVRGRVSGNLPEGEEDSLRFDWQDAPDHVKCAPNFQSQSWVPWNESMADVPRKP